MFVKIIILSVWDAASVRISCAERERVCCWWKTLLHVSLVCVQIYKSTKCNDMVQTGACPRGAFCAFAHVERTCPIICCSVCDCFGLHFFCHFK